MIRSACFRPRVYGGHSGRLARAMLRCLTAACPMAAEAPPLAEGETMAKSRHFTARLDHALIASLDDVRQASACERPLAARRAADRQRPRRRAFPWRRTGAASRPKVRSSSGSRNLPWGDLLSDGRLRPAAELTAAFAAAGIIGQADHRDLRLRRFGGDFRPGHGHDGAFRRRGL